LSDTASSNVVVGGIAAVLQRPPLTAFDIDTLTDYVQRG
jgi:hypothetical protein